MSDDTFLGSSAVRELRVLQISDCHIKKDAQGELLGIRTRESLEAVLSDVRESQFLPDLVIVSGDLAQDGSQEAYHYLRERFADFDCPVRWFPGNHDHRENMMAVVGQNDTLEKCLDLGAWRFLFLDSLVPGAVYGHLSEDELEFLAHSLEQAQDKNVLVCLHHQPVDIDSEWLDHIGLSNKQALFSVLDEHGAGVKGILWGHIHQTFEAVRGDVKLMASPSTCIQFLPQSKTFALDDVEPGYRCLSLANDGLITSEVRRAVQYEYELDMSSDGY